MRLDPAKRIARAAAREDARSLLLTAVEVRPHPEDPERAQLTTTNGSIIARVDADLEESEAPLEGRVLLDAAALDRAYKGGKGGPEIRLRASDEGPWTAARRGTYHDVERAEGGRSFPSVDDVIPDRGACHSYLTLDVRHVVDLAAALGADRLRFALSAPSDGGEVGRPARVEGFSERAGFTGIGAIAPTTSDADLPRTPSSLEALGAAVLERLRRYSWQEEQAHETAETLQAQDAARPGALRELAQAHGFSTDAPDCPVGHD